MHLRPAKKHISEVKFFLKMISQGFRLMFVFLATIFVFQTGEVSTEDIRNCVCKADVKQQVQITQTNRKDSKFGVSFENVEIR